MLVDIDQQIEFELGRQGRVDERGSESANRLLYRERPTGGPENGGAVGSE